MIHVETLISMKGKYGISQSISQSYYQLSLPHPTFPHTVVLGLRDY